LLTELAGHTSLEPGVESFLCLRIEIPTKVEQCLATTMHASAQED
jgi:hypothetical protein